MAKSSLQANPTNFEALKGEQWWLQVNRVLDPFLLFHLPVVLLPSDFALSQAHLAAELAQRLRALCEHHNPSSSPPPPPRYRHLVRLDSPQTLRRLLEESRCTFLVVYHRSPNPGAAPEALLGELDRLAGQPLAQQVVTVGLMGLSEQDFQALAGVAGVAGDFLFRIHAGESSMGAENEKENEEEEKKKQKSFEVDSIGRPLMPISGEVSSEWVAGEVLQLVLEEVRARRLSPGHVLSLSVRGRFLLDEAADHLR